MADLNEKDKDMEATNGRATVGGTIEPANRGATTRRVEPATPTASAMRFELRDPFADVTYRLDSFKEMTSKADQLGAVRFVALGSDGSRTLVNKVEGEWRAPEPPARSTPAQQNSAHAAAQPHPAGKDSPSPSTATAQPQKGEIDADRAARIATIESGLAERYVLKRAAVKAGELSVGQTEYRYRGDTNRIAFTESTSRLATETNNPSVARSMVDVAEARGWKGLRVSGHEDFRRLVWIEASLRGVKTLGYEQQPGDQNLLKKELEARAKNRIEPGPVAGRGNGFRRTTEAAPHATKVRGGRKAVLAALEAVLVSRGVPSKQREAVMAAADENLAKRLRSGEVHQVKVKERDAAKQTREATRVREVREMVDRGALSR